MLNRRSDSTVHLQLRDRWDYLCDDMEALTVRPPHDADMAAVTAIYAHYVEAGTSSFETVAPDEAEMRRRWRSLIEDQYPCFVAERGGDVCGFAYAGPYRVRPAYRHTVENSVYVERAARQGGIGTALLRTLIQACTDQGFRQMVAIMAESEHPASIRLHLAAGFEMVGTLRNVGYKHGRWLDTVLMQRELGEGARSPPGM